MKEKKIISWMIIAIGVLMAVRDGVMILWKNTGKKNLSSLWHSLGLAIRIAFFIIVLVDFFGDWASLLFWGSVYFFVAFVGWNIIINIINGLPVFYLGTTSKIDVFFSKNRWLYYTIIIMSLILPIVSGLIYFKIL